MFLRQSKYYLQKLKNYLWHLPKAIFANIYYRFPSNQLTLIGITGTDGKTTTTHLIHHFLVQSGLRTEVISTINSPGLHTTSPDSIIVQKLFRDFVNRGITHVVVEVTAHAIDQFRYWGCHFQIGVLTNISHEHLDDFISMDNYVLTKAKFFRHLDTAILNQDDPSFPIISQAKVKNIITYGIKDTSNFQAKNIKLTPTKLSFRVNDTHVVTNTPYRYQVFNILAAIAVANHIGLDLQKLAKYLKNFPDIKGRRQEIKNSLSIRAIVDFAHTPAALKQTLSSLKSTTSGKLIVIFGATGGRDSSKRPLMGQVVSKIADIAVITADDTRHENINLINQQIIAGINHHHPEFKFYNIPDRQEAFNLAIKLTKPGDTVVACGKGHETTILHGSTEYPWSEADAFRTAFRQKHNV